MNNRYCPQVDPQQILNVMMQCILTCRKERHKEFFEGKSDDDIAQWVREQLAKCDIFTQPRGGLHAMIQNRAPFTADDPRTDLEIFTMLHGRFGIDLKPMTSSVWNHPMIELKPHAHPRLLGYTDLRCEVNFDERGKFLSYGIWM